MSVPLLKENGIARAIVLPVARTLRADIEARRARVAVVGLGYVGLPLASAFAEAGFRVTGLEVDEQRVEGINRGQSHVRDVASSRLAPLVTSGQLRATSDARCLSTADVVVICVPTPLTRALQPDLHFVEAAVEQVAASLRPGQLIILESTTYPGTTREVVVPRLEQAGLRAGEEFFVAFSPERVDPGNPVYGITNTPKVVGGIDAESTELAAVFYSQAIERVVPVSSPDAAEMVKLLENTFRAVNIALANEMAQICEMLGIDVWEVIEAAATKPFGFMPFYPGPGVGGHCIPLDPLYLSWKLKTLNYDARFIDLASRVNRERPHYVAARVLETLRGAGKPTEGARVLVLGVAYKPDIDDPRESPAIDVIEDLLRAGVHVMYTDPHVPVLATETLVLRAQPLTDELVRTADCVVVITHHRDFDYDCILRHARLIVDTRNAIKNAKPNSGTVIRL